MARRRSEIIMDTVAGSTVAGLAGGPSAVITGM